MQCRCFLLNFKPLLSIEQYNVMYLEKNSPLISSHIMILFYVLVYNNYILFIESKLESILKSSCTKGSHTEKSNKCTEV